MVESIVRQNNATVFLVKFAKLVIHKEYIQLKQSKHDSNYFAGGENLTLLATLRILLILIDSNVSSSLTVPAALAFKFIAAIISNELASVTRQKSYTPLVIL